MEFVYIPPGVFEIGSRPEEDTFGHLDKMLHRVMLTQGFYMQTTPVTQIQWKAVMKNTPSFFKGDGNRPVERVSWNDAQAFIKSLNARAGRETFSLPTETQWEIACHAGTRLLYYTGDKEADLDRAGWYSGNAKEQTHPACVHSLSI